LQMYKDHSIKNDMHLIDSSLAFYSIA